VEISNRENPKQEYGQIIVNLRNALEISNQALKDTESFALALQEENQIMKPKAEFYDVVIQSESEVDMKQAAKILNFDQIGRNKAFRILREAKVLMKNNEPYQEHVTSGCFRIAVEKFSDAYGQQRIYKKTVVTAKGLDFMRRIINEYLANATN